MWGDPGRAIFYPTENISIKIFVISHREKYSVVSPSSFSYTTYRLTVNGKSKNMPRIRPETILKENEKRKAS